MNSHQRLIDLPADRLLGVAKFGYGERELIQHLPTTKSHGILRLCHRRPTTTGMRWQKAWRGALWVVGEESGWEGCDWMRREARTRDCFSLILCLRLSGGGLRR
jgi:hypothetical protein